MTWVDGYNIDLLKIIHPNSGALMYSMTETTFQ